jgi:hypothetical protein
MAKTSIPVAAKKRGRPPGQKFADPIPARLTPDAMAALDAASAAEPGTPSRSELIRRIVTEWLRAKGMMK